MWSASMILILLSPVLAAVQNDPLLEWLSRAGSLGILAAAVVAFLRGWIVSGRAYAEVRAERDKALELVYKQANLASRAVDLTVERLGLEAELKKVGREWERK